MCIRKFLKIANCKIEMMTSYFSLVTISAKIFKLKENKTNMKNIHPRFFHLLFKGLRLGFKLGCGLWFDLGIVLE